MTVSPNQIVIFHLILCVYEHLYLLVGICVHVRDLYIYNVYVCRHFYHSCTHLCVHVGWTLTCFLGICIMCNVCASILIL